MKTLIIGGGIIGLSIGWQLARNGKEVHLIERREVGKQTSWVAAGMLTPDSEAGFEDEKQLDLGLQSLALYPQFLEELRLDTGVKVSLESQGTLFVGIDRDDREWLHRLYTHKKILGSPVEWLSGEQVREREPLLSPRINCGILLNRETQINNRNLIETLKAAFISKGGFLSEGVAVQKILTDKQAVVGVQLEINQEIDTDQVINASGVWANQFCSPTNPIIPIKGQIFTLKMNPHYTLSKIIRTPRVYLVPKKDGSLRVGATSEDVGFDEQVTTGAALDLLKNAREIFPAIEQFPITEMMVGLRPVTSNHLPIIGATSTKGLYQAIGHGRAGILLAPYTAYSISHAILNKQSGETHVDSI